MIEPFRSPSWEPSNLTIPSCETANSTLFSSTHICQDNTSLLLLGPPPPNILLYWSGAGQMTQSTFHRVSFVHKQLTHSYDAKWETEAFPCCPLPSPMHSFVSVGIQGGTSGEINKTTAYTHIQASPEISISSSCQEILNRLMIFLDPLFNELFCCC